MQNFTFMSARSVGNRAFLHDRDWVFIPWIKEILAGPAVSGVPWPTTGRRLSVVNRASRSCPTWNTLQNAIDNE